MGSQRIDRISELVDKLIKQNELYETFLNSSPWGILVVDKTFHIVFINSRLEEFSGYSLCDVLGEHLHKLLPESDHSIHTQHEKRYVKSPVVRTGNHGLRPRIKRKDGTLMDVEISISPGMVEGKTYFFASVRPLETLFDTVEGKVKGT